MGEYEDGKREWWWGVVVGSEQKKNRVMVACQRDEKRREGSTLAHMNSGVLQYIQHT